VLLVEASILREEYAKRKNFYRPLILYELCLLKSIWNVSFVTAVAPCFIFFFAFFRLFLHVVFDIEIPHKGLQHILKEASKAVKATCSFAINNGFFTAFIIWITCLNQLMISTTLTISRSLVFTSCYNSASSAGLITIAPETWPTEGSSRNFFIEKWLLV